MWGKIRKKSPNEAYDIKEEMTANTYHYSSGDRNVTRRLAEVHHECDEVPIILDRPFLATGKAVIDVEQEKLTLRLDNKKVLNILYGEILDNYPNIRKPCLEILENPNPSKELNLVFKLPLVAIFELVQKIFIWNLRKVGAPSKNFI
ncbi:hypothetical protein CR513_61038, partial [Mucuna pruriens]